MASYTISAALLGNTFFTARVHASQYTCISQDFDYSTCETDQAATDFSAPCADPICLQEECCKSGDRPGHTVSVSHWSDPVWLSNLPSGAPPSYPSGNVPLQGDTGPSGSTGTPSDTAPTASAESIAAHANAIEAEALTAVTEYAGESLPGAFVDWLQNSASDFVRYSILSARHPHLVLIAVRSMQIDLGDTDWTTYLQLVLARAIVDGGAPWENRGLFDARYSLAARTPITLTIPGDERVVVDCSLPENLDDDCHIINFLNSMQVIAARTTYDGDTAIETENQTRNLWPSDVMPNQTLTDASDSYMAANGVDFRINILPSEHYLYQWDTEWGTEELRAGKGDNGTRKRMKATFERFRVAMENKGQLPNQSTYYPERVLSGAELILYYKYIAGQGTTGNVGLASGAPALGFFPVTTAPWPILTWLGQPKQNLRGMDQLWNRYKQTGFWRLYGEYVGKIAQDTESLRLRRMAPTSYGYASMQMNEKDGGVCGTMCHMGMYSHDVLGYPSSNTGQPGHCMVSSWYPHPPPNASSSEPQQFYHKLMQSVGNWYETYPNKVFPFGDWETARYVEQEPKLLLDETVLDKQWNPLAWTLGVGAGVNDDKEAFASSLIAYRLAASISEADRAAYGVDLYLEIVRLSPFFIGNIHRALDLAKSPFDALKVIDAALEMPGFATQNAEYPTWVRQLAFLKILSFNLTVMSLEDRGVLLTRMEALNAPSDMVVDLQLQVYGVRYVLDQRKAGHMRELANRRANYNEGYLRPGNEHQEGAMNDTLALFDTTPGLGDARSRAAQKTSFAQEMVDAIGGEGLFVAKGKFYMDLALDVFVQAGAVLPTVADPLYYYRHACEVLAINKELKSRRPLRKLYDGECDSRDLASLAPSPGPAPTPESAATPNPTIDPDSSTPIDTASPTPIDTDSPTPAPTRTSPNKPVQPTAEESDSATPAPTRPRPNKLVLSCDDAVDVIPNRCGDTFLTALDAADGTAPPTKLCDAAFEKRAKKCRAALTRTAAWVDEPCEKLDKAVEYLENLHLKCAALDASECTEDAFATEYEALKANCSEVVVDYFDALHEMSQGVNRPAAAVAAPLEGLCTAGCGEAVDRLVSGKYGACVDEEELLLIKGLGEAVCSEAKQSSETCGQQLTETFGEDEAGDVVQKVCDGGCMATVPEAVGPLLKRKKGNKQTTERVKDLKTGVQATLFRIKQTNKAMCAVSAGDTLCVPLLKAHFESSPARPEVVDVVLAGLKGVPRNESVVPTYAQAASVTKHVCENKAVRKCIHKVYGIHVAQMIETARAQFRECAMDYDSDRVNCVEAYCLQDLEQTLKQAAQQREMLHFMCTKSDPPKGDSKPEYCLALLHLPAENKCFTGLFGEQNGTTPTEEGMSNSTGDGECEVPNHVDDVQVKGSCDGAGCDAWAEDLTDRLGCCLQYMGKMLTDPKHQRYDTADIPKVEMLQSTGTGDLEEVDFSDKKEMSNIPWEKNPMKHFQQCTSLNTDAFKEKTTATCQRTKKVRIIKTSIKWDSIKDDPKLRQNLEADFGADIAAELGVPEQAVNGTLTADVGDDDDAGAGRRQEGGSGATFSFTLEGDDEEEVGDALADFDALVNNGALELSSVEQRLSVDCEDCLEGESLSIERNTGGDNVTTTAGDDAPTTTGDDGTMTTTGDDAPTTTGDNGTMTTTAGGTAVSDANSVMTTFASVLCGVFVLVL